MVGMVPHWCDALRQTHLHADLPIIILSNIYKRMCAYGVWVLETTVGLIMVSVVGRECGVIRLAPLVQDVDGGHGCIAAQATPVELPFFWAVLGVDIVYP